MARDERSVDDVRAASDIVEIIGQSVTLKKSGSNFKGLCPFHGEKTPSFMVHPEKQIFHCFGCAVGGDVFTFLMRHDNMSFPEALEHLAERAHITLPESTWKKNPNEADHAKLYEIGAVAREYYHAQLHDPKQGQAALDYLSRRGVSPEDIREFQLGWAADAWRGLYDHLSRRGFSEKNLLEAGLIKKGQQGKPYDVFRARVLFPILNVQGKVIGFGGRMIAEGDGPKYLNSSESPVFQKRRELFGLYYAKKHIDREKPRLLVVEGYMDFLALYKAGFKNTVATLGTALTEAHVQVLKRFSEEAIVIYDGDRAGLEASLKGLEVFLEGGMNVKLVRMPEGDDPDDFVRREGASGFQKLLDGAVDFFDFKLQVSMARYNVREPLGVMHVAADFAATLAKIKNPVLTSHYLGRLSSALRVDESSLRAELGRIRAKESRPVLRDQAPKPQKVPPQWVCPRVFSPDEMTLIALMVEDSGLRAKAFRLLKESDFTDQALGEIFRELLLKVDSGETIQWAAFLADLKEDGLRQGLGRLAASDWPDEERKQAFDDCLVRMNTRAYTRELDDLRFRIKEAEERGDPALLDRLLRDYQSRLSSSKEASSGHGPGR